MLRRNRTTSLENFNNQKKRVCKPNGLRQRNTQKLFSGVNPNVLGTRR